VLIRIEFSVTSNALISTYRPIASHVGKGLSFSRATEKISEEKLTMKDSSQRLVLLYSRDQIARRISELAALISADYAGADLVLVGTLRGSFVFLADLIRQLTVPAVIDFVSAASYGSRTQTSGQVTFTRELQVSISGRDLLLVEDIEDTGITLQAIQKKLKELEPRSIKVCALIDKRERRQVDVPVDYVGFRLDKGFIVGYGIDYAEQYRCLPDIYRLEVPEKTGLWRS
jgi:hypoxanthine phosphoribosyltransferase